MTDKTTPTLARGRFPTPYLMIWAVLASLSFAYLALLAFQPALLAGYLGGAPNSGTAARQQAQLGTDVQSLKDGMSRIRVDLEDLKAEVSGQSTREREYVARLEALESSAEGPARVAATDPADDGKAPARARSEKATDRLPASPAKTAAKAEPETKAEAPLVQGAGAAGTVKAKTAKDDSRPARVLNDTALETGSVEGAAAPPVSFGTPVVIPPAKPLAIQIATGPSIDALRLSWSLLSGRHSGALDKLQPRYVAGAGESGLTYDLVVGPIATASEAKRICKELGTSVTQCTLGLFTGDTL